MSDEELDSVFRRVANEYSPEVPPPGAWERLDSQLATTATTQQLRGKVLRAFGAEVATLAVLVWLGCQLLPENQLARLPEAKLPAATTRLAATEASRPRLAASTVSASPATTSVGGSSAAVARPDKLLASVSTTAAQASVSLAAEATPEPTALVSATAKRVGQRRLAAGLATAPASPAGPMVATGDKASRTLSTAAALGKARRAAPAVAVFAAASPTASATPSAAVASASLAAAEAPGGAKHRQHAKAARNQALPGAVPGGGPARQARRATGLVASSYLPAPNTKKTAKSQAGEAESLPVARLAEASMGSRAAWLSLATYPLPDSLGGVARLLPADTTKEQKPPALRPPYRLVLGLLGAPAFSAVRTPQTAQLGGDYGLTLEYLLTPRLRVRAGLISSRKRYYAASSDYEAPANWQWFPGNYELDANCRITEIPLDVRFDVLRRPTYAVFTSVGINSLLMRNEQYSYDWTMNGQTFTKTAQVVNGSNHFLGVLNLSVGVERPIGGRWSAQVEPFWQLPLGGVGAGKVHLSSAGAAFSLKFGLIR